MSLKSLLQNQTVRFSLFILTIILFMVIGSALHLDVEYLKTRLHQMPLGLSGSLFIFWYVVLTLLIWWGPKDVFRVSGAIIFGPYLSTLFVWIAETISAVILFNLSRRLGRGYVEEKMKVKAKDLDETKKDMGWFNVTTIRLNPLVPFRFMDLAYGLTKISFRKYFLVVLFASVPRILWLQIILAAVGASLTNLMDVPGMLKTFSDYFFLHPLAYLWNVGYLLVVVVMSLMAVVLRMWKKNKKS